MMMNQMYLTLPSNDKAFAATNKTGNFRVKLPYPINLVGDWECALVEIQYPYSWDNIRTEDVQEKFSNRIALQIRLGEEFYPLMIHLNPGWYNSKKDILSLFKYAVEKTKMKNEMKTQRQKERLRPETVKILNDALDTLKLEFKDKINRFRLKFNPNLIKNCDLGENLQYILGFDSEQSVPFTRSTTAKYPPDFSGGLGALFVYCNLVEPQIVGGSMVPLLRTVGVKGEYGKVVDRVFWTPQYLNLRTKTFDTVEISIYDDTGQPIKFNFGKTVLKLHLRRKQVQQRQ